MEQFTGEWTYTWHNNDSTVFCHYQDDELEFEIDLDKERFEELDREGRLGQFLCEVLANAVGKSGV